MVGEPEGAGVAAGGLSAIAGIPASESTAMTKSALMHVFIQMTSDKQDCNNLERFSVHSVDLPQLLIYQSNLTLLIAGTSGR
jgi:hypothetical protein